MPPRKPSFLRTFSLLLLVVATAWAHDPFETSVVSRLQHGRLEVSVTMTFEMAGLLVDNSTDPDGPQLNGATWPQYRDQLETRARGLYDVTAGGTVLTARRAVSRLVEGGHLQVILFYPEPQASPLRFRPRKLEKLPSSYLASLDAFDAEERLLGRKLITPGNIADAELSVEAAIAPIAPIAQGAPAPVTLAAVAPAVGPGVPWFELGLALVLVVIATGASARLLHKPPPRLSR